MQRRVDTPPVAARACAGRCLAAAALILLAVGLAGCEPYVEGNGVLREETREVPAFVGLALSDGIQATVTAGAAQQLVKVSGDENVLQYVDTVVVERASVGRVLEVKTESSYQSRNPLRVSVSVPAVSYLAATGASPVTVTGAAATDFTVEAADGSHLVLSGGGGANLAVTLAGGQHGGASLDARGYPVGDAQVRLTAGARAQLAAAGSVQGTVAGGSVLENVGEGACTVTADESSAVTCSAP